MPAALQVMSTLAVELALKRFVLPAWTGPDVQMSWNPTGVLLERVRAGERGDVLIAIDAPIRTLADQGIVRAESIRPLARAGFGVGIRAGTAVPDISTVDGFRATLLAARAVAYSLTGASGLHFLEVIEELGIANEVKARAVTIPAGFTAEKLMTGEADLAIQQISELMSVEGVDVAGPFPATLQRHTDFSAAVFSEAAHAQEAAAFIHHLCSAEAGLAYDRCGLASRLAGIAA